MTERAGYHEAGRGGNGWTGDESVPRQDPRGVRLAVVTEVRLYREGLVQALACYPMLEVVAVAANLAQSIETLPRHRPDVVLVDAALARQPEVARRLGETCGDAKVIAFAVAECDDEVLACLRGGVCGCIPRDASIDDLVTAIEGAVRGEAPCSPSMAAIAFRELARGAARGVEAARQTALTAREEEICTLLDSGLPNKEIARRLGIEVPTVKNHVHHILQKLSVGTRREAAALLRGSVRGGRTGMRQRI
ncbi:MAG: response regulator transcription factor [Gemmatimonadaceae bacterium]